ncbi:MAG: M48 family metalloprotease, partial [Rhodospirillales bacterium]|nr:M48 family metalloprotease [Rhodospirillales bacterium]
RFLLALLGLLAGCTSNPATGESSFTGFMSTEEERRIGAEQHPKLVAESGGIYSHRDLGQYVDRVGQSLARHTEVPNATYKFTVLDDDAVNAFALPGGYIHVTRGLLALASNEAELGGVLAHELGHVVARHSAQQYSEALATTIGVTVLSVAGAFFGIPPIAGDLVGFGAQAYLQNYSRDQEMEADRLAVRYMTRAGYDPQALVTFFGKLDANARLQAEMVGDPDAADRFNIMSSHPRTIERLRQASNLAAVRPVTATKTEEQAYLAQIDGIVFGDSPEDGIRRGRNFVHPDLRIAFRVPPGFVMRNSQRQLTAIGPDGSIIVFDSARDEEAARDQSVRAYLTRDWASSVSLRGVETFQIQEMEAATGLTRLSLRQGRMDARLVAIRTAPDRIYRFLFLTPPEATARFDEAFKQTAYSFRRLNAEEAREVQPLRIVVRTVAEGDSVRSLAEPMPFDAYDEGMFRLMNGLRAGAEVQPGQQVKVVVP